MNTFLDNDNNSEKIRTFIKIMSVRVEKMYKHAMSEQQSTQKNFSAFYAKLHAYQMSENFENESRYILFVKNGSLKDCENHIAFRLFKFVTNLILEEKQCLIPAMNAKNLYKYGEDFAKTITDQLLENQRLKQLWIGLFTKDFDVQTHDQLMCLFEVIVVRFVKPL